MRSSPIAPITDDGRLKPRGQKGAVIEDAEWAAARVLAMLEEQALVTESGARLPTPIDSICVHGDTAHAVEMTRRLRAALEQRRLSARALRAPRRREAMRYAAPRWLDAGEAALVVEFGDSVDPAINAACWRSTPRCAPRRSTGIVETVPTYRSLMIHYEPLTLSRAALVAHVRGAAAERCAAERCAAPASGRLWIIPCCYEPPHGGGYRGGGRGAVAFARARSPRCMPARSIALTCMASRRAGAISAACRRRWRCRAAPRRAGRRREAPC